MAGPFGFDSDFSGLWVVVEQEPLCPGCKNDDEVDAQISRLKADLDRVVLEMKADLRKQDGQALGQDAKTRG